MEGGFITHSACRGMSSLLLQSRPSHRSEHGDDFDFDSEVRRHWLSVSMPASRGDRMGDVRLKALDHRAVLFFFFHLHIYQLGQMTLSLIVRAYI